MLYGISNVYEGVCDVQQNFNHYFDLLTNKCCNLFKWEGLPETVDENWLNLQLVLNGKVCFTKFEDKIYALNGNVGGKPNVYYQPQFFIVANPILGSKQVRIRQEDGSSSIEGLDGILMSLTPIDQLDDRNMKGGLYRLIYQTAGLLADNISSLNVSQINGRVAQLWTADNDTEARTIEEIVRDMYNGHPYRVLTQDLISKIGVVPAAQTGQSNTLLNLIEASRSIWQDFYNQLGIGYQGNAKRERVNTAEIGLMRGNLDVNLGVMLKSLKEAVEKINKLLNTSIEVELNEEVFYEGSGNATLGEVEDPENSTEKEDKIEEVGSQEDQVDEKNTEKIIEIEEKKGNEGGDEE